VKVLLDECVDRRLAQDFADHEVSTVNQMGWDAKANGELLTLAEKHFEVFVTTDRNLSFQQNLKRYNISVVVLTAQTNRLADLRLIVPALLKALPFLKKGEVREIGVQT
jgi:predicted nuclease of predicted toxin-antitoxin system